jgi:hypothetical protein
VSKFKAGDLVQSRVDGRLGRITQEYQCTHLGDPPSCWLTHSASTCAGYRIIFLTGRYTSGWIRKRSFEEEFELHRTGVDLFMALL